jgi:ATP phosphoribosyltransferase regulatory subunit
LVGASGPAADAELIALLHRSLSAAGIGDLTIAIGDISLTEAILDGIGVPREIRTRLGRALAARNLVEWQEIAATVNVSGPMRELLYELPAQRGGREVLSKVCQIAPGAEPACKDVSQLLTLLEQYGIADDVMLDVGIARDWPYYSGVVLEAHSSNVGAPLAVGGRYDRLAERFGTPRPAVGCAIDLDVLNRALTLQGTNGDREASGVVVVDGLDHHLAAAESLRARGVPIVCLPSGQSDPAEFAARDGWRYVVEPDAQGFRVLDTRDGSSKTVSSLEDVVA